MTVKFHEIEAAVQEAAPAAAEMAIAAKEEFDAADKSTAAKKASAWKRRALATLGIGMYASMAIPQFAFAASLEITDLNSILEFIGNVILVVGLVLAAWNLVQAGMSMKDNQGFQMDKNVWGIVGGIAMCIAGGAIKTAGSKWGYGNAA